MKSKSREETVTLDFRKSESEWVVGPMQREPFSIKFIEYEPNSRIVLASSVSSWSSDGGVVKDAKHFSFDFPYLQFWNVPYNLMVTASDKPFEVGPIPDQPFNRMLGLYKFANFSNFDSCSVCLGNDFCKVTLIAKIKAFWNTRFDMVSPKLHLSPLNVLNFTFSLYQTNPALWAYSTR